MASPLRAFRKYQKQMLVFFGVLLMIAFILGGVLTSMPSSGPGGREPQDSISVRWDGASYSQDELETFLRLHIMSQRFLAVLAQAAQQEKAVSRTDPSLLPVSNDQEGGIRDAANILLQADEANRLGVRITEEVVDNYLRRVCDGLFSEAEYMQLLKESTGGQLSLPRLKQHLKTELAALRLQDIIFSGMGGPGGQMTQFGAMSSPPEPFVTPTSAVVSQERMTNTAKIEFLPVDVEPFLDQIKDSPSNSVIRDLYERGAVQFPGFQKKTPGFRVPDQATIQWFKTDQDSFLPPVDSITEEMIQEEYNRRVEAKDLSVVDQTPDEEPATPMEKEDSSPEGESTEENDPEGETSEGNPAEGSGETPPPAEEAKPEDSPPQESTEDPQESSTENGEAKEQKDGQSSLNPPTATQFVSAPVVQEETQQETKSTEETQEEKPAEAAAQESTESAGQEGEADAAQETTENQETTETSETPTAETEGTSEPQEPVTKFKPLEDVREDIVEDLRRQEAGEKRNKALEDLTKRLNDYFIQHEIWDAERIDNPGTPAPTPPNFEELAKEQGITFGQTEGLVDFAEFNETELGQSFSEIPRSQFNFQNFPTVAQTMFQSFREGKEYQPKTTLLRDYIYWMSEKEPQHVPTLDEARDDIIRYWKWNQAVEMAKADAEAKLAQGGSLVAEFPGEAFESQPFSWLSIGGGNVAMGGGQLSLSSVNYQDGDELKQLDTVGNDFMRTVFNLSIGDEAAAVDAPRETVFAVRLLEKVTEDAIAEATVKNQTLPSQNDQRVIGTSMGEYRDDWVADLLKRRNVRWIVKKVD
jgi:hypothetical protein